MFSKKVLAAFKPFSIHEWKNCSFFLKPASMPFKYNWMKRKSLSSLEVRPDEELTPYCRILDRYPTYMQILESWSQALLEYCSLYGGPINRETISYYF